MQLSFWWQRMGHWTSGALDLPKKVGRPIARTCLFQRGLGKFGGKNRGAPKLQIHHSLASRFSFASMGKMNMLGKGPGTIPQTSQFAALRTRPLGLILRTSTNSKLEAGMHNDCVMAFARSKGCCFKSTLRTQVEGLPREAREHTSCTIFTDHLSLTVAWTVCIRQAKGHPKQIKIVFRHALVRQDALMESQAVACIVRPRQDQRNEAKSVHDPLHELSWQSMHGAEHWKAACLCSRPSPPVSLKGWGDVLLEVLSEALNMD